MNENNYNAMTLLATISALRGGVAALQKTLEPLGQICASMIVMCDGMMQLVQAMSDNGGLPGAATDEM